MVAISLTDTRAHLGKLIDRAAAGTSIDITRHGKPIARLSAVNKPRKPIDAARLQALTATMSPQPSGAVDLRQAMRDGDRY